MPTRFRNRDVEPDGSQCILQHAPLAHMHVHITACDERQPKLTTESLECGQPLLVSASEKQLDSDSDFRPKAFTQPPRLFFRGLSCSRRHPKNKTVLQSGGSHILPAQGIGSLGGGAPSAA